ncbi:MAG: 4'-phosphopantetheinyl transferase family protein [Solirubrobacteraceae bacterium]
MIERIVPDGVACAETRSERVEIELFAQERSVVARAVPARRLEFAAGRACARLALERLGAPIAAIPSGLHGEPLWPAGVVGSITHCRGYRACAVARSDAIAAIGIDAEPNAPLPPELLEEVAYGREREQLAAALSAATGRAGADPGAVHLPRLLFSAKEAVYKAWFPLARRWLGFDEVELTIDRERARFRARLLVEGPVVAGARLTDLRGRWTVEDGVICSVVVVAARGAQPPDAGSRASLLRPTTDRVYPDPGAPPGTGS